MAFQEFKVLFFFSFRFLDAQFFLPSMRNKEGGIFGFFSITRKKIKGVLFLRDRKKKWDSSSFRREDFIRIFETKFKKGNNERASSVENLSTVYISKNSGDYQQTLCRSICPRYHHPHPSWHAASKSCHPLPLPPPGISSSTTRTPTGVQSRQVVT